MIPNEKCYEIQNNTLKIRYFDKGFCVMGQNNETICPGDSGSPIIWEDPNDNNRAYLVGIASQKEPTIANLNNPYCGPLAEIPAKYAKVIDGNIDILEFWFNGGKDFDSAICKPHKPGCHLNHTIDYLRDQERKSAKKPRLST